MNQVLAGFIVVAAMVAPYLVVAALTAAFPKLRRGIGQIPRTDEMVARFFDRTIPGAPGLIGAGQLSERSRQAETSRR